MVLGTYPVNERRCSPKDESHANAAHYICYFGQLTESISSLSSCLSSSRAGRTGMFIQASPPPGVRGKSRAPGMFASPVHTAILSFIGFRHKFLGKSLGLKVKSISVPTNAFRSKHEVALTIAKLNHTHAEQPDNINITSVLHMFICSFGGQHIRTWHMHQVVTGRGDELKGARAWGRLI